MRHSNQSALSSGTLARERQCPAFEAWVNAHNEKSNLYSAYPALTVQTILNS